MRANRIADNIRWHHKVCITFISETPTCGSDICGLVPRPRTHDEHHCRTELSLEQQYAHPASDLIIEARLVDASEYGPATIASVHSEEQCCNVLS